MSQLIELTSKITSVEVYRSQALVTRQATVELGDKTGSLDVRLTQLPFLLRDDSVRVDLMGQSGVRVVDVHLELELGSRQGDIRTPAEDQLTNLLRERLELYIKKQQQIDQLRFFSGLSPAEHDEVDLPREIAFSERHQSGAWLELSDYVRGQMEKHYQAIRQVEREIRALNDQIAKAQNELAAESQATVAALAICRKAARLQLELEKPVASLVLEFSYMVPAARWVPDYELRVDGVQDRAELVFKALVAQRTGEEWTMIDLAFSTADLQRSTELPELDSWRIGKAQPPRPSGWKDLPDTISELFEGYDRDLGSLPAAHIPDSIDLPRCKRVGPEPKAGRKAEKKRKAMLRSQIKELAKMKPPPAPPQQAPQAVMEPCEDYDDADYDVDELRCEECEAEPAFEEDCLSMPVASAAPAPMKQAKRKSAGGLMRTLAGAVSRGLAHKEEFKANKFDSFGGGAVDAAEFIEDRIEASSAALSYRSLRMQGPETSQQRGQLLATRLADRISEQISQAPDEVAHALREVPPEILISSAGAGVAELYNLGLPVHAVGLEHSAGHFAARYAMESPGNVLSDGQLHALTLLRRDGDVQRVFRCVPRIDTNVYQVAEFVNPLNLPLLAGAVRVFSGQDFIVTAPLKTTPPGKTIRVNLGVEEGISIARNTTFAETTSGLLGGDTDLKHTIVIDVNNKLAKPVRVEIFERVPISHDDDIEVKVISAAPNAKEYDQTDRGRIIHGGRKFELSLQPGEEKSCRLEYQVTIPSKQVLVGGNRRD
jgi:uncharacterized protein DUF4139/uncharacterized protein DUF4140